MISPTDLPAEVRAALKRDLTIDIVTRGAKSGLWRTVEIWFTRIDGRIIICGTPGAGGESGAKHHPRHWLANMKKHRDFWFCLKESILFCLPASARVITDMDDRRYIMSHDATVWYREHGPSVEDMVEHSPIVEVDFVRMGGIHRPIDADRAGHEH